MALLEHKPHYVRKMIALGITAGVGLILGIILVFMYTRKEVNHTDSGSKLKDFYTTIVQNGQSIFTRE